MSLNNIAVIKIFKAKFIVTGTNYTLTMDNVVAGTQLTSEIIIILRFLSGRHQLHDLNQMVSSDHQVELVPVNCNVEMSYDVELDQSTQSVERAIYLI